MNSIKIFQVGYSDINGGAARAAYRIHHALRSSGIDSQMLVNVAVSGDWKVQAPNNKSVKAIGRIRPQIGPNRTYFPSGPGLVDLGGSWGPSHHW